ncbi:hypothetical protein [Actinomyces bouchesdurhonensis]|uniref:hypothetical protein n=1 Tax=Actinomyces bouchesdurhonensis TaxID=1852361 RepID=UPI0023F0CC5B|nr:hypothetical protein [Actinomyces bouchesdurhonensis]
MITTDQLQADLSQLREALDAFAFALNSRVIQKGHIVLPTAEVTGEYLASLPVGLDLYERERTAVRLDELFTARRETTAVVRIPLSNGHSGKLITYGLKRHDGHTHVEFTLAIHQRDFEAADSEN